MTPPLLLLPAQTIGAQLDDLLAGRWLPATCQTRIHSASELPARVERRIRVLGPHATWRAYSDSAQTFCAIARVRSLVSGETTTAALEVRFLNSDAQTYAGAVWAHDHNPGWRVHSILHLPRTIPRPDFRRGTETLIRAGDDPSATLTFWSD